MRKHAMYLFFHFMGKLFELHTCMYMYMYSLQESLGGDTFSQ